MQRPSYGSDAHCLIFTSLSPGTLALEEEKGFLAQCAALSGCKAQESSNGMQGLRHDEATAECADWDTCCFQEWAALSQDCCLLWKTGAQPMLSSSSSPITKATSHTLRWGAPVSRAPAASCYCVSKSEN